MESANQQMHHPWGRSVANAGLVLLVNFLPHFFKNLQLLSCPTALNNVPRAISLMQYLVFKDAVPDEYTPTLENLLCGQPVNTISYVKHILKEAEKSESELLLEAVIGHWKELKNVSPDGLRDSFLRRSGKLNLAGDKRELIIEPRVPDMLLNTLPWNYNLIKLPWMSCVLKVG